MSPPPSPFGSVILLNGTSSAGKSTLTNAVQDVMDASYLHLGIEEQIDAQVEIRRIHDVLDRAGQGRLAGTGGAVEENDTPERALGAGSCVALLTKRADSPQAGERESPCCNCG
jgi:hypothetical protein